VLRIGPSWPVRLIGERINPTANKPLAAGLVAGRLTELKETALSQTEAGADALDVNISTPNVDEKSVLPKSVLTLQNLVPLPLVIDSTDLDAIEAGLRACAGRCLLNSVSGKPGSAERLMPMAKKYGAALVLLPVDERGIPRTAEERIEVLERLLSAALKAGFSRNDLIADGLVMAAATGQSWVPETLRTIRLARERLGLASILGVSNVSFGFPNRPILNANFLAMACAAGLDAAIINPSSEPMRQALDASAVLTGRDPNGRAYIGRYASAPRDPDQTGGPSTEDPLRKAVLQGARSEAPIIASDAMKSGRSARDLLDTVLLPAMTEVGRLYEKGTYFLPQLILAAETMQEALKVIKPALAVQGSSPSAKGRLVIATVKGDVHDIGKNIVSLMLENDGWAVLDLGKDVPNEAIIEAAISHRADLVCLSALMTTTMTEMSAVAGLLKTRGLTCGLLVGGAAVNARFAEGIGAGYAPDAFAAIRAASRFLPKRAAT
jgi:5-methyltetrahydrofolate--homocysteine methyltransferase